MTEMDFHPFLEKEPLNTMRSTPMDNNTYVGCIYPIPYVVVAITTRNLLSLLQNVSVITVLFF